MVLPDITDSAIASFQAAAASLPRGWRSPSNLQALSLYTPLASDQVGSVSAVLVAAPPAGEAITVGVVFFDRECGTRPRIAHTAIDAWPVEALPPPAIGWRGWGPVAHGATVAWGRGNADKRPEKGWVATIGLAAQQVDRVQAISSGMDRSVSVQPSGAFLILLEADWDEEPRLLGYNSAGEVVVEGL